MRIHATNTGSAQARMSSFDGAEAARKRFVRNPDLRTVQPAPQPAAASASPAPATATSGATPRKTGPGLLKRGGAAIGAIGAMTGAYDSIRDLDTGYREEFNKSIGSDGGGRGLMSGDADLLRVASNVGNAITGGYAGRVGQGISSRLSGGTFSEGFNEPTHRDRFMARMEQPARAPQTAADNRDLPTSQEAPIAPRPTKAMGDAFDANAFDRDMGPRSAGYEALRNDMGSDIDRGLPAPGADGSDARNRLIQRGNAGLRALASDEGLRTRMNDQYRRDNLGVQATTDAQGRMVFSDAPRDVGRPATHRAISSGGDMGAVNQSMARANEIRGGTGGAEGRLSGSRGGGIRAPEPMTLSQGPSDAMLSWQMRTGGRRERDAAARMLAGRDEQRAQAAEGAAGRGLQRERMAGEQFITQQQAQQENRRMTLQEMIANPQIAAQQIAAEQAGRINALQRQLQETQDPEEREQIADLLRRLTGQATDRNAQVIYDEELLDPAQPMAGVRKVPMVLNRDGTATRVTQRQQTKPLPPGITRKQAIAAARQAVQNGYDATAIMARLGEYGLTTQDLQR